MKDQPWDLNQTWPVCRKWFRFTNAQKNFGALPQNLGRKKNINFRTTFAATSSLDTAYLRNETSHRQTKMLVSIYNVFPASSHTFRDRWPRNGWDPFAYCDALFGGHYVAIIKVATSLVIFISFFQFYSININILPSALVIETPHRRRMILRLRSIKYIHTLHFST